MKKILALAIATCVLLSTASFAFAEQPTSGGAGGGTTGGTSGGTTGGTSGGGTTGMPKTGMGGTSN